MKNDVAIIGAGLAGSEAALQLARFGYSVDLFEMRPMTQTEAHKTDKPAELVCSNSFKSLEPFSAPGMLKTELKQFKSPLLEAGFEAQIPGGQSLTLDREVFSRLVQEKIKQEENIRFHSVEIRELFDLPHRAVLIATGPLTSPALSEALKKLTGTEDLYFYDAIAPIISAESIDWDSAFLANRYQKGGEDVYVNCPLNEAEYQEFIDALLSSEVIPPKNFEKEILFQGCQPIERIAASGRDSLRFGPMKPVGLTDPKTGKRPYAVVQLRPEQLNKNAYNLVGFQTKLSYRAQPEVFRKIPALKNAQFIRFGSIHRNTYINSPSVLSPDLSFKSHPKFFAAGQVAGVEGYLESASMGLLVALAIRNRLLNADQSLEMQFLPPPPTTILGGLYRHLTATDPKNFQPMNACFAILNSSDFPLLEPVSGKKPKDKDQRRKIMAETGASDIETYYKKIFP